jgi:dynein heavy chain 2, cytosolic
VIINVDFKLVKKPMDEFILISTWSKSEISQAALSIAVDGLLLQGCNFDGMRLSECSSDDASQSTVPTTFLAWMPKVC